MVFHSCERSIHFPGRQRGRLFPSFRIASLALGLLLASEAVGASWWTRLWTARGVPEDRPLVALSRRLRAILEDNHIPDLGLDPERQAAFSHPEYGAQADYQAWISNLRAYRRQLETFHSYRDLPLVAEMMDEPLEVPWRLPASARQLTAGRPGVDTAWRTVARGGRELFGDAWAEAPRSRFRFPRGSAVDHVLEALVAAADIVDREALAEVSDIDRERLRHLLPWLCQSGGRFQPTAKGSPYYGLAMIYRHRESSTGMVETGLDSATAIGHFLQALAGFPWPEPTPLLDDPPETVAKFSAQIDFMAMGRAVAHVRQALDDRALTRLQRELERMARRTPSEALSWPGVEGELVAVYETPYGPILIGGHGTNRYLDVEALAIIDLGGDDDYVSRRSGERIGRQPLHVIVDFAGDDLYLSEGVGGPGAGVLGIGVLIDREGDDRYIQHLSPAFEPRQHDRSTLVQPDPEGEQTAWVPFTRLYGDPQHPDEPGVELDAGFAFGAAFLGVGLLVDEAGDDLYLAQKFAFGCGFWQGIGVLHDTGGDDVFAAGLAAIGVGVNGGLGVLDNRAGNDHYQCLGTFESGYSFGREWDNGYLSCGIGYGASWRAEHRGEQPQRRPTLGGGIGLLLDGSGDDSYIGSSFGVAASYAGGVGAIIDAAGNDTYFVKRGPGGSNHSGWSGNHALGNGCHRGVGFLLDRAGNDRYSASSLGGGTAWDMAAGYLIDLAGDDQLTDLHGVNVRGQTGWGAAQAFAVSCHVGGADVYHRDGFGNAAHYNPDYPGRGGNFSFFFDFGPEQNQYPRTHANDTVRSGGVKWLTEDDGREYPAGIGLFMDGKPAP